jgi:hypothetical protein
MRLSCKETMPDGLLPVVYIPFLGDFLTAGLTYFCNV